MFLDSIKAFSDAELFPYQREMDEKPAHYKNQAIHIHPQFEKIFQQTKELGLIPAIFNEEDGFIYIKTAGQKSAQQMLNSINLNGELQSTFSKKLGAFKGAPEAYELPEGYVLKDKAISLGVPGVILVTEKVKNTYEESLAVTKMIPKNSSIILVTSAFHMLRSKYLFEKQGFDVIPYPVDFKSSNSKISIMSFLPKIDAFYKTSIFIRENIGRLYYNLFF